MEEGRMQGQQGHHQAAGGSPHPLPLGWDKVGSKSKEIDFHGLKVWLTNDSLELQKLLRQTPTNNTPGIFLTQMQDEQSNLQLVSSNKWPSTPYGDLLFVECYRIYPPCYFGGQSPHQRTTVTSSSQLSCHSNEVWQIGQVVGKQNPDLCSLCVVFSISAAISDRMTADHAVNPDGHDDRKTSLQSQSLPPIYRTLCMVSVQNSFHAQIWCLLFSWRDSSAGQAKTSPHPPHAQQPCSIQRFS